MRVFITGVTGFVGLHLVEHISIAAPGAQLFGLQWEEARADERAILDGRVELLPGDLTDPGSLDSAAAAARPDVVFHLAAAASVTLSWQRAARAVQVNALGTIHLLEALHRAGLRPTVVVASSAEIYGRVSPEWGPVTESCPIQPVSPYGASKAAQDMLASQLGRAFDLPVLRMRSFNLTGPRRPADFVVSSFARQVARVERGLQPPRLRVGNLEVVRDFTDVRDAARAYWLAATAGEPGEAYNLCSGRATQIAEVARTLAAHSQVPIQVDVDPELVRSDDIPWLVGDPTHLQEAVGWAPAIPLERTLADVLTWWRQRPEESLATLR